MQRWVNLYNFRPGARMTGNSQKQMKIKFRYLILISLIFLEQFFLFFPPIECSFSRQAFNSTAFFICSLLFGLVILRCSLDTGSQKAPVPPRNKWFYPVTGGIAVTFFCIHYYIIHKMIYVGYSDIIPNIQILAQRFLHGKTVYSLDAWKDTTGGRYYPFYLPMHWAPFLLSESLHFDPRYITFSVFLIAVVMFMYRSLKCADARMQFVIPAFLCITYIVMAKKADFVSGVTIEPMIIGFYLFFIVSLQRQHFLLSGLVFTLCLLSRYYIAIWLPLWCFVMLVSGNGKYMLRTIGITIAGVCILFVIPFLSHNWSILSSIGNGYDLAIISEWTINKNNYNNGLPYHLFRGHGFAYLFYSHYAATDKRTGFHLLKKLLLIIPFFSTMAMGLWFYPRRDTINIKLFLIGSFKVYLAIFLNFMIVPYIYLFVTSAFLSVAIFGELDRFAMVRHPQRP